MLLSKENSQQVINPRYYLNTDLFFLLRDGVVILWDYKNHQQFSLTSPYFQRLLDHSRGAAQGDGDSVTEIDQKLLKEGILLCQEPPKVTWNWDALSYIFHIGTRNIIEDSHSSNGEWLADYLLGCEQAAQNKPSSQFVQREGLFTPLMPPNLEMINQLTFQEILQQRQTIRNFNGKSIQLETLSTLLFITFGLFHGPWKDLREAGLCEVGLRKTSASGGGLHPNEAYVSIHHVEGIEPGIYHYDVLRHGLVKVNDPLSDNQVARLCMGQPFGEGLAFGVFLVAYLDKIWWKYSHSRGYRVALLDAGHLSQTFQLVATSLGVLTWMTANIHDVNVSTCLKLDGVHQAPIHFLAGGYGLKSGVYQGVKDHFKSKIS